MSTDDKSVALDEARRIEQHEAVKSHVEHEVNAEVAAGADRNRADAARIEAVAGDLRRKALEEVVGKDRDVDRARGLVRGSQMLDYAFYLLYGLLAIRLVLALVAARPNNGFVRLISVVTDPFYALFRGIVPSPSIDGGYSLVMPIVVAIVVYALLHAAIKGLMRVIATRKTEI